MQTVGLYEDKQNKYLLPISYFKHFSELTVGCFTIFDKWKNLGFKPTKIGRTYLKHKNEKIDTCDIWISARVLPDKEFIQKVSALENNSILKHGEYVVAIKSETPPRLDNEGFLDEDSVSEYKRKFIGKLDILKYPWDIMLLNSSEINKDKQFINFEHKDVTLVHLMSTANISINQHSVVLPGSVINADAGPVIIDEDAVIGANVYLEGPLYIGKNVEVKPFTSIKDSSIHKFCKVGGEISSSVMMEYSNKVHHGFLGSSVLGSWVNLGAGTTTSNLKNNYSNIHMMYFNDIVNLDTQFLGLIMGDHSKSAINSTFNTGTIVGANCNIFGTSIAPKMVPSFMWGGVDNFENYKISKAKATAKAVMKRRGIEFTDALDELFDNVYKKAMEFEY